MTMGKQILATENLGKSEKARMKIASLLLAGVAVGTAFNPSTARATPVNVLYASQGSSVVAIQPNGMQSTLSSGGVVTGYGEAFDASGNLFSAAFSGTNPSTGNPTGEIYELVGGTGPAVPFAAVTSPVGLAYYQGSLYVASYQVTGNNITKISNLTGTPTIAPYATVAGTTPSLFGVAADSSGNLYVADSSTSSILKIAPGGSVSPSWGTGFNNPEGVALDSSGNLLVADQGSGRVLKVASAGGAAGVFATGFTNVTGVAFDSAGSLFASDQLGVGGHFAIQQIGTSGSISGPVLLADGGGSTAGVNNYRFFTFATPEPASLGLLGFAAIGVLARRRRMQ